LGGAVVISKFYGLCFHYNLAGNSEEIFLCGVVVILRDSVVCNNNDLVPALAEGLIIRFLFRGLQIVLLILLVPLIWAFLRIVSA
jgi:hypothetical protein